jgi:hypothetical protein
MKKLLVLIFGFISFCAIAQNAKDEFNALRIENQSAYSSSEFSLINKKIPFAARDATLQQLSDTTKPNKQEKIELERLATSRRQAAEKGDQITIKYLRPPEYLSQIMETRKYYQNLGITILTDLYAGKITFGEYNRKRKEQSEEYAAKNLAITNKFKSEQAAKKEQSRGRVIASASEQGVIFLLYDGPCNLSNLAATYPNRWDATNPSTNQNIASGCYFINQSNRTVMMSDSTGSPSQVSFATFGLGGDTQKSTLGAIGDALSSIGDGIAGAQRFQQPPPGFVYVAPGVSRSNYMQCTPDGRGGYYCR